MNDKELRYMIAIQEYGSIQKAAAVMERNASSLSRTVRRVEEDLDVKMFRRTPQGLLPTPEGEVYLQAAKEILSLYDGLKLNASEADDI